MADVDRWVLEALAYAGISSVGSAVTYKIRFWSVVRCYPTEAGLFWFKENNPGQAFEAGLVAALAELTPDQGSTLGDSPGIRNQATRLRLVHDLAALQRAAVEHAASILAVGVTDARPSLAGRVIRDRAARLAALPTGHPLRPARDLVDRLGRAADRLDELAGRLSPAIPASLDHNDLHAFNVSGDATSGQEGGTPLRFFDFGDAVWGHPFATLRSLVISLPWTADLAEDCPATDELIEAYLSAWTDLADLDTLRTEYRLTAALQPVVRMVSWYRLLDHADLTEITAWIESPTHWLHQVAALAD